MEKYVDGAGKAWKSRVIFSLTVWPAWWSNGCHSMPAAAYDEQFVNVDILSCLSLDQTRLFFHPSPSLSPYWGFRPVISYFLCQTDL